MDVVRLVFALVAVSKTQGLLPPTTRKLRQVKRKMGREKRTDYTKAEQKLRVNCSRV